MPHKPDPDLQDRYFEALAQRVTQGRIPSTREPLPLRSLAELMADLADEVTRDLVSEARGTVKILGVLVDRLGGDVTIRHTDLAANMDKQLTQYEDQGDAIRLTTT
jgi:hypothetical protein